MQAQIIILSTARNKEGAGRNKETTENLDSQVYKN